MKIFFYVITLVSFTSVVCAQKNPLNVEKIILSNGLTIFLNEDTTAKEVFGAVVVKAGSKNDPKEATGIAHYLEHLLFKGTQKIGTVDYQAEKKHLDSIVYWYNEIAKTKDEIKRKEIQQEINTQSVKASQYAIPTEFDRLITEIGGTKTNAFTSPDMTVYHNYFPSEQVEKLIALYSERFINPVFRSFQSELEVVYEEKNRSMDNFMYKIQDDILANSFPNHPYGTQTTLGSVEHLKNPSLRKMYEFFNTYYVANNMAVILSGNFNSQTIIPILERDFSRLPQGEIPNSNFIKNDEFKSDILKNVRYTPVKAEVICYKTVQNFHKDLNALNVISRLLFNQNETGKLNQLKTDGKLLFSGAMNVSLNDDGIFGIAIVPKLFFQSFDKAEKIVLEEIEKIKNGDFSEEELQSIKQNISIEKQNEIEDLNSRAIKLAELFSNNQSWEDYLLETQRIEQLSKEEIVRVAQKYLSGNKLTYRSKMGFPKKTKLTKPEFEPVQYAKKEESVYAKEFKNIKTESHPKFINFNDVNYAKINSSVDLYCNENKINDIFSLKIEKQVGSHSIKSAEFIASLFNEFYTEDYDLKEVKKKFSILGINYYVYSNENRFYIEFKGLEKNLIQAIPLINELINHPKIDKSSISNAINEKKAELKFIKKSPHEMGRALFQYARFGDDSEYLDFLSVNELKKYSEEKVIEEYQKINAYNTTLFYTGKKQIAEVKQILEPLSFSDNKKQESLKEKINQPITENTIYYIENKKNVQNQVYIGYNLEEQQTSFKEKAIASFYNEYLFGGFSGILLQEVRELRSLAYSSHGVYRKSYLNQKDGVLVAYAECQADKTDETLEVIQFIFNEFPEKPERMDFIKSYLRNSTSSKYPEFRKISEKINLLKQYGFNLDPLQKEYELYSEITFEDLKEFHKKRVQSKSFIITIYGNLSESNIQKLQKLGNFKELKIKNVLNQ
ncbi:MAG: insulinase family protein [Flavobacteriales bacterium]|nr:insulinase family protein [Flavobacteriales bacterium]